MSLIVKENSPHEQYSKGGIKRLSLGISEHGGKRLFKVGLVLAMIL